MAEAARVVLALGEEPGLRTGRPGPDPDPLAGRPLPGAALLRGKTGMVEAVIEPAGIDNEEEAYGRNAGGQAPLLPHRHPDGRRSGRTMRARRSDGLRIEVFETWLERI